MNIPIKYFLSNEDHDNISRCKRAFWRSVAWVIACTLLSIILVEIIYWWLEDDYYKTRVFCSTLWVTIGLCFIVRHYYCLRTDISEVHEMAKDRLPNPIPYTFADYSKHALRDLRTSFSKKINSVGMQTNTNKKPDLVYLEFYNYDSRVPGPPEVLLRILLDTRGTRTTMIRWDQPTSQGVKLEPTESALLCLEKLTKHMLTLRDEAT